MMADVEQLRTIKEEGVEAWNKWRKANPEVTPDLSQANFYKLNLSGANLNSVNFNETTLRKANLSLTNLSLANLTGTILVNAILQKADMSGAILLEADLWEANLRRANLKKATLRSVNLSLATLEEANLYEADLSGANLWDANLSEAFLEKVNLSRITALETNFKGATLTGACIEDWNINSKTNFDNVICDYIYLKQGQQERRPAEPNRNFQPGEFAKLVQKSLNTIDLIFSKGADWRAVAYSIKNTQVLNEDTSLAIQSIENKGDGVVLIKVNVPENADKGKIEGDFWQGYEFANKTLKEQYEARILDKDKEINRLFTIVTQGKEVQKLMAEQPKFQQNFNAPVYGNAQNIEGNQNIYASEKQQTLAQAAEEIQNLLKQLDKTNPTATEAQQIEHLNDETTPKFKRKVVAALKAAGDTAIDEFLDNSYVKVGKAAIMGWMESP